LAVESTLPVPSEGAHRALAEPARRRGPPWRRGLAAVAVVVGAAVLALALAGRAAAQPSPGAAQPAYAECVARWSGWSSAGGIWTGDLTTPGARRGDPGHRRIQMHLKFGATGVAVSVRRPGRPWRLVGSDPSGAPQQDRKKDQLFIAVPNDRPGNRLGHAIMLTRLGDALAEVTYTRTVLRPRPGEALEEQALMSGVLARAGTTVPAGAKELGPQCVRRTERVR